MVGRRRQATDGPVSVGFRPPRALLLDFGLEYVWGM